VTRPPLFLARRGYRRRRLIDAARVLPAVGAVRVLAPLLFLGGGRATSASGVYLFGVWLVLILGAAVLARYLRTGDEDGDAGPGG